MKMTLIEIVTAIDKIGRDFGLTEYEWEDDLAEAFSYTLDILRNHDADGIEATIDGVKWACQYAIDEGLNENHELDSTFKKCDEVLEALYELAEEC